MVNKPTMADVLKESPIPWKAEYNVDGAGQCRMVDTNGNEVSIFTMFALLETVTDNLALKKAAAKKEAAA